MLLLVSESFERWSGLYEDLTEKGIFLLRVPFETAEFICDKYDIGGVLIDACERPKKVLPLYTRLKELYPEMPIATVGYKEKVPWIKFDARIEWGDHTEMMQKLLHFCLLTCRFQTKTQVGTGLTIGYDCIWYEGVPLSLSPRQMRVLRFLAYRAPHIVGRDELLSVCYPTEWVRQCTLSGLIAEINARAAKHGLAPLIVNVYGKGYLIRSGIFDKTE